MAPTANLEQKDKQFVAKVSRSPHLGRPSEGCQATDNQELKHFYLKASGGLGGEVFVCVCVGVCMHVCVYYRGLTR